MWCVLYTPEKYLVPFSSARTFAYKVLISSCSSLAVCLRFPAEGEVEVEDRRTERTTSWYTRDSGLEKHTNTHTLFQNNPAAPLQVGTSWPPHCPHLLQTLLYYLAWRTEREKRPWRRRTSPLNLTATCPDKERLAAFWRRTDLNTISAKEGHRPSHPVRKCRDLSDTHKHTHSLHQEVKDMACR